MVVGSRMILARLEISRSKMCSAFNLNLNMTEDEHSFSPAETVFSLKEWKRIIAGTAKNALPADKQSLRKTFLGKFPIEAKRQPGPKPRTPTDVIRQRRQNFLWVFRQILDEGRSELTDLEVCHRACLAIFNFDQVCGSVVFLNPKTINFLRTVSVSWDLQSIDLDEAEFWEHMKSAPTKQRDLGWGKMQGGEILLSQNFSGNEIDRISALFGGLLPKILSLSGDEFRIFAINRKRTSDAGRPKLGRAFDVKGTNGQTYRFPEIIEDAVGGEQQPLRPPPSEEEILEKAFGRLLLVKNLVFKLLPLELPVCVWNRVLEYQNKEWCPQLPETRQACEELWTAAHRQPRQPWEEPKPIESAGDLVELHPFGVLECDI